MKKSRRFFMGAVLVAIGVSLMAERPIIDTLSPVSVLKRSDLEVLPAGGRDLAEFAWNMPGFAPGPGAPDEVEMLLRGADMNPSGQWNSAELNIIDVNDRTIKHCAHGARQGNVYHFDLNGNGQDSSDPGLIQYNDGMYLVNIQNYVIDGNLASLRLLTALTVNAPSFETITTAYSGGLPSPSVTRRHGGPVLGYLPVGRANPYTIAANNNMTNPLDRPLDFFVYFRDDKGVPADLEFGGQIGSEFPVEINPYSASTMNFRNLGSPKFYSAEFGLPSIGSEYDLSGLKGIQVSADYNTWVSDSMSPGGSRLVGSAGLAAPFLGTIHTVPLIKTDDGGNTGISIVNVTSVPANVSISLVEKDPTNPGKFIEVDSAEFELPSWNSRTQFGLQYFGRQAVTTFDGTAVIQSDATLGVTPLTTLNGFQQSSIPAGVHRP